MVGKGHLLLFSLPIYRTPFVSSQIFPAFIELSLVFQSSSLADVNVSLDTWLTPFYFHFCLCFKKNGGGARDMARAKSTVSSSRGPGFIKS